MYILCVYQKTIILCLFKIDALNFTMYVLTILTCPLKACIIRLHNLISMNIFFTKRPKQIKCWSKRTIRSSCSLMFFKIGVLKNFLICKGKHQLWSLFSINLQACNFVKKGLQHSYLPVNITRFLRAAFFREHLRWLFLNNHCQFEKHSSI